MAQTSPEGQPVERTGDKPQAAFNSVHSPVLRFLEAMQLATAVGLNRSNIDMSAFEADIDTDVA